MIEKVRKIGSKILDRHGKIYLTKSGYWYYEISTKGLMPLFRLLDIRFGDPPTPPKWVLGKREFFGAYLAGVIDGDGDVRIKRSKYPQCVVRVSSGSIPTDLIEAVKKILGCSVSIGFDKRVSYLDGRKISGGCYRLEFYISSKPLQTIKEFVLPSITIQHKKEKIEKFADYSSIRKLGPSRGIELRSSGPQPLALPLS